MLQLLSICYQQFNVQSRKAIMHAGRPFKTRRSGAAIRWNKPNQRTTQSESFLQKFFSLDLPSTPLTKIAEFLHNTSKLR
jgi:hypothetical protein